MSHKRTRICRLSQGDRRSDKDTKLMKRRKE